MKMPLLILIWFILADVCVYAQQAPYEPLADYDLEKGTYSLLFLSVRNDTAYYIDRVESLLNLQKSWSFEEEAVVYPFACTDGYKVLLLDSQQVVDQFSIRLRCQSFTGVDNQSWHLLFSAPALIPGRQVLMTQDTLFQDLQLARAALEKIRSKKGVTWVLPPIWERFEGYFHFNVPNPNHSGKAPTTPWEEVTAKIERELKAAFPKSTFQLILHRYGYGKHYPTLGFKLTGQKELFDRFDLYPQSSRGWQPLALKLTYYK